MGRDMYIRENKYQTLCNLAITIDNHSNDILRSQHLLLLNPIKVSHKQSFGHLGTLTHVACSESELLLCFLQSYLATFANWWVLIFNYLDKRPRTWQELILTFTMLTTPSNIEAETWGFIYVGQVPTELCIQSKTQRKQNVNNLVGEELNFEVWTL